MKPQEETPTLKQYVIAGLIGLVCLFIFWAVIMLSINVMELGAKLN